MGRVNNEWEIKGKNKGKEKEFMDKKEGIFELADI